MPTFTSNIPLENLLEPRVGNSPTKKPLKEDPNPNGHLYISPALYATPEQAPLPEHTSPDPLSPSPYVVNLKRRRAVNETGRRDGSDSTPEDEGGDSGHLEVVGDSYANENLVANDEGSEMELNDFVGKQMDSRSFASAQGEFFDAIDDDFSSDGSVSSNMPSYGSRIQSELSATRLSILEEIERRKTAEETLFLMRCQWERISNLMTDAGLTFPAPPVASDNMQLENNLIDQLCQEVFVTRFVSEAIARGVAHAEAEEAASSIIESKDQEILRLKDRLQYYETVNHEMSQRKLVEVARRQRERKRSRRKWIWSFMGLSIAIGVSLAAYAYIPGTSLKSANSTDASRVSSSDTS